MQWLISAVLQLVYKKLKHLIGLLHRSSCAFHRNHKVTETKIFIHVHVLFITKKIYSSKNLQLVDFS